MPNKGSVPQSILWKHVMQVYMLVNGNGQVMILIMKHPNTGTLADLQEQVNTIHNNIPSKKSKQYKKVFIYPKLIENCVTWQFYNNPDFAYYPINIRTNILILGDYNGRISIHGVRH